MTGRERVGVSVRALYARDTHSSTPAVRPRYACDTLAVRAPHARDTRSMHPQYDRGTRASIVTRQSFPASQHSAGSEKPRVDSHKSLDDCGNTPLATDSYQVEEPEGEQTHASGQLWPQLVSCMSRRRIGRSSCRILQSTHVHKYRGNAHTL